MNGLSPNKIWSSCRAPTEEFYWSHVFGCPVYVLNAALQDRHKIPKWAPRARLGFFLGCFEDVDYDGAGNAILPPLTSLFQHDDFANEIVPTSQWTLDPNNITSPLAPGAPSPVPSVFQTMKGGVVPEGVPSKTEAHIDSAPEGASHESQVQLDHSPATVIPINSVDNGLSASGWPQCNVGNYKQGPAKI